MILKSESVPVNSLLISSAVNFIRFFFRHEISYTGVNLLRPVLFTWQGDTIPERIADIEDLRCDGIVEICYELNGIDAWGAIVDGSSQPNYSVIDYLGEHNNFFGDWRMTLQPATQCGHAAIHNGVIYKGVYWDTKLHILINGERSNKTIPPLN